MRTFLFSLAVVAVPLLAAEDNAAVKRLDEASVVFNELMAVSDKGIPRDLLSKSHCAVIVPGLKKGAFIVGAQYGKGVMSCRGRNGVGWTAPASISMTGGSVGFQIGGSETDLLMLVMNKKGAERMMSNEFKIGGEVSAAAGPIGRTTAASTDATMRAEILSWSRARGVFAGASVSGSTVKEDMDSNAEIYGTKLTTKQVFEKRTTPAGAKKLLAALRKASPRQSK